MAGTIAGTVVNVWNMEPIDGATVTANPGAHSTATGGDGSYSLSLDENLSPGYELIATTSGFEPFVAGGVVVVDDVPTEVKIALRPSDS